MGELKASFVWERKGMQVPKRERLSGTLALGIFFVVSFESCNNEDHTHCRGFEVHGVQHANEESMWQSTLGIYDSFCASSYVSRKVEKELQVWVESKAFQEGEQRGFVIVQIGKVVARDHGDRNGFVGGLKRKSKGAKLQKRKTTREEGIEVGGGGL